MRRTSDAGFSVRQRLTAAVALLTAAALVAVGLTLYVLESRRIDADIDRSLAQEIGEMRTLQTDGRDPETQQPFGTPDRLLDLVPLAQPAGSGRDPLGLSQRRKDHVRRVERPATAEDSRAFTRLVAELEPTGGTRVLSIEGNVYRIAVQPIVQGDVRAAFVVSHDVSASRKPLRDLMVTYALLSALSVLLIAAIASWLAGRLLQPVRQLRETAQGITEGDLSGRLEVTGNDDLTDLQRTFNDMLDRLEDAFATQRRLLDDAAHELRTPLTVLRGHLEVVDTADAQDVEATRTLLLDEVDRMARLVSDLLLLARAQRPDFVRAEPTDVEALTHGALERARGLGDRGWTLDAATPALVSLDAQRITQALLQLAHNAVQHTADGDEIGIGSNVVDHRLELWVRDTGAGVPESMRANLFDRFAQAEPGHDGFGLGLSIVSAIAEAHGGRAELDEARPESVGATFRLVIPIGGPR